MKKVQMGLAMLLSVFIISCSDDDDNGKQDQGVNDGPVTQQDTGTTQDDTGTTQDDTGTTEDDTGAPEGACTNAEDMALLDTEEKQDAVRATATTCATQCLVQQAEDLGACSADCLATDSGLSAECSACYGGVVICTIGECTMCIPPNDPNSEDCLACQETNCLPDFYSCSGMTPPAQ